MLPFAVVSFMCQLDWAMIPGYVAKRCGCFCEGNLDEIYI